jgi:peptidoglycan/LPS O-acetylase OafA/YrhL
LLTFVFDPYTNIYAAYGFRETAMLFITSVFMIPYPVVSERYFNLFNLNAPSWSLFWEYVANLAYATILFKASKKILTIIASIAAVALFYIGWQYGNLLGGWNGETFLHGFARIAFSFSMGMLVHRSGWIIKNKLGLLGMCALLMLAFLFPYNEQWTWLAEPLIVIFYFPLLVSLGAGATLSSKFYKINKLSGDISYPLYMTHYPFMWVFANYVVAEQPSMAQLAWIIPVSTIALVALAYVVMQTIDTPVRSYLKTKLKDRKLG